MTDATRMAVDDGNPFHDVAAIFPLIGGDDYDQLVEDIRQNGLLEPIWVHDGQIVDGRNRWRACRDAGVAPTFRRWDGTGSLVEFVMSLNMHRRHLTTGQKAAAAARSLPMFEKEALKKMSEAGASAAPGRPADDPEKGGADLHHLSEPKKRAPRSTDKAAKAAGTSGRALAQYKRVESNDPELAAKVEAGDISLDRAERIIRDREAEQKHIAEAQRQADQLDLGTSVDIRHGDFRHTLDDLTDVDAIITDPPYPQEFIPLMDDLGRLAARILKPNGLLVVLMGQTYLPDVYDMLGRHLDYRWTGCYMTPGPGYRSHARRVQSNWKPLLVYGSRNGARFGDVIESRGLDADAKNNHKWGQDFGAFQELVRRFTSSGDLVVDPFAGSGTTLLAAKSLGRHAVGCDIDAAAVHAARERAA